MSVNRELLLKLAEVSDLKRNMMTAMRGMLGAYAEPVLNNIDVDKFVEATVTETYGVLFTSEEIQNLVDFYESPVGRKLIRNYDRISELSSEISRKHVGAAIDDLENKMREGRIAPLDSM